MKSAAVVAALCLAAGSAAAEPPKHEPPQPPTDAKSDHRDLWRGAFYSSVAVVVAGGGMWFYGAKRTEDASHMPDYHGDDPGATFSRIGMVGVGVGGTVAMVALYKGFIAGRDSSTRVASRKHPRTLVVTPVISADGGGATLRLDW